MVEVPYYIPIIDTVYCTARVPDIQYAYGVYMLH